MPIGISYEGKQVGKFCATAIVHSNSSCYPLKKNKVFLLQARTDFSESWQFVYRRIPSQNSRSLYLELMAVQELNSFHRDIREQGYEYCIAEILPNLLEGSTKPIVRNIVVYFP